MSGAGSERVKGGVGRCWGWGDESGEGMEEVRSTDVWRRRGDGERGQGWVSVGGGGVVVVGGPVGEEWLWLGSCRGGVVVVGILQGRSGCGWGPVREE